MSYVCHALMTDAKPIPARILPIIIIAQFTGTSLWFAANAVLPELINNFHFDQKDLGTITSAVQLGFISGTLLFAIFTIADKYSPSKVFFVCATLGAIANLFTTIIPLSLINLSILRFFVGVLLAGIYPVGMKISADWFDKGLGKALGYLVGALVLGTAFPHLIRALGGNFDWTFVLITVSSLSFLGGVAILLFVPDGPHRKKSSGFKPQAVLVLFKEPDLRSAAYGYFGHMWELYTFWAFVPFIFQYFFQSRGWDGDVSAWSFVAIASGFLGSAIGGIYAQRFGSARVAYVQLFGSLICILLTVAIDIMHPVVFVSYMVMWGTFVVGDSPQFSTLAARTAPKEWMGSALTIMNSIGFALTIPSIILANYLLSAYDNPKAFLILAIGPIFGLYHTRRLMKP